MEDWKVHTHSPYYAFVSSLSGARLPFTTASIEPFCRPVQRRRWVTAPPVFARSFFLAESDPAVLLSCQIFLHAKQIALADTLNNPQQLFHRGDLIQARDRQEVSH